MNTMNDYWKIFLKSRRGNESMSAEQAFKYGFAAALCVNVEAFLINSLRESGDLIEAFSTYEQEIDFEKIIQDIEDSLRVQADGFVGW